ncbi:MAG: hypothetical protein Q8M98_07820 [Candidatus Cloacimonadaceae bacterium]|nr:hypothetical protein [Candidatus Cloacimonadaceae bacterium]
MPKPRKKTTGSLFGLVHCVFLDESTAEEPCRPFRVLFVVVDSRGKICGVKHRIPSIGLQVALRSGVIVYNFQ